MEMMWSYRCFNKLLTLYNYHDTIIIIKNFYRAKPGL